MRRRRAGIALLAMLAAGAVASPAAGAAAGPSFTPRAHRDAVERQKDPLDLRSASFGQVGTQLALTLRTAGRWSPGGSLCVSLARGDGPAGRLCVAASRSRRPVVRFRAAGSKSAQDVRGAAIGRSGRTLRVLVYPRALGLRPGSLRWFATSRRGGVSDRLPDSGDLPLDVSVYGAPRCFGAASRAGDCTNPALQRLVTPAPSDAELSPDFPCHAHHVKRYEPAVPCEFGATYARGPARLALIGDSHAMSLRAPVEVAAQALGVKAISLTQAGCGFATDVYEGWPPVGKRCRRNNEQVLRWLEAHPSVDTVVLAASAAHGYTEDGMAKLWSRIPASVTSVYVMLDVPRVSYKTEGCVKGLRKRHDVSAGACAVPRDEKSLPPDPAPGAVARSAPRVHLIDLTRLFCDSDRCFPVIGGAYVYRDTNHMNTVFASTLGPYLLEAMGGAA